MGLAKSPPRWFIINELMQLVAPLNLAFVGFNSRNGYQHCMYKILSAGIDRLDKRAYVFDDSMFSAVAVAANGLVDGSRECVDNVVRPTTNNDCLAGKTFKGSPNGISNCLRYLGSVDGSANPRRLTYKLQAIIANRLLRPYTVAQNAFAKFQSGLVDNAQRDEFLKALESSELSSIIIWVAAAQTFVRLHRSGNLF